MATQQAKGDLPVLGRSDVAPRRSAGGLAQPQESRSVQHRAGFGVSRCWPCGFYSAVPRRDPQSVRSFGIRRYSRIDGRRDYRTARLVRAVDGCCKKKHQQSADLLGAYGPLPGIIDGTHEQLCGLAFNLRRTELRRASSVADGIGAAFQPHAGVIQSLCDSDDEAQAMYQMATMRHSSSEASAREAG